MILSASNLLDLIILLGAVQGIIFGCFLWVRPLKNKKASFYLGLFLLSFAANSIYFTLETLGFRNGLNAVSLSPLYCSLWILTSLYFFIQYLVEPNYKRNRWDFLFFIPPIFQTLVQLVGFGWYFLDQEGLSYNHNLLYSVYDLIDLFLLLMAITVLVKILSKLRKYEKKLLDNFAEIEDFSLSWIYRLLLFLVALLFLFAIPNLYEQISGHSLASIYYPMWISFSVLIYWMGYSAYFRNPSNQQLELAEPIQKSADSKLSENTTAYHESLKKLMTETQPFLDQDLSLKKLALHLDISSGYLSQIINQYEGKNFFDYINGHRVEAVKRKMADPDAQHLNLLGMAYESGFKSKSTFNLAFKKSTGKTPTAFKKSITKK